MTIKFINPEGRENTATLTSEQSEILRNLDGYKVVDDFDFLPATPPSAVRPRIHISDSACTACEG